LDEWDGLKNALRQWLVSKAYQQARPSQPAPEFLRRYHPTSVARQHLEIYREVLNTPS
jgi:hypothetical protein